MARGPAAIPFLFFHSLIFNHKNIFSDSICLWNIWVLNIECSGVLKLICIKCSNIFAREHHFFLCFDPQFAIHWKEWGRLIGCRGNILLISVVGDFETTTSTSGCCCCWCCCCWCCWLTLNISSSYKATVLPCCSIHFQKNKKIFVENNPFGNGVEIEKRHQVMFNHHHQLSFIQEQESY